jgi:hypothetical protein
MDIKDFSQCYLPTNQRENIQLFAGYYIIIALLLRIIIILYYLLLYYTYIILYSIKMIKNPII